MLFSIIIPVFNGSDFVKDAIASVLSQEGIDRDEYEIIVVDDGSNDDGKTVSALMEFGNDILILRKENGGVSSALNLGIQNSSGEYICWLSHDDLFRKSKLASQKKIIETLKSRSIERFVLHSDQEYIDKTGNLIDGGRKKARKRLVQPVVEKLGKEMALGLMQNQWIGGCTIVVPRALFNECDVGLFHEGYRYIQDFEMWFRMALSGVLFVYEDVPHVGSRIHEGQQTGKNLRRYYRESKDFYFRLVNDGRVYQILKDKKFFFLFCLNLGQFGLLSEAVGVGREKSVLCQSKSLLYSVLGFGYGSLLRLYRHLYSLIYR